jgi:hypothetical protein
LLRQGKGTVSRKFLVMAPEALLYQGWRRRENHGATAGLSQSQSLSVELTGTYEKAGSHLASHPASKAMESRDFDSEKSPGTT